MAQVSAITVLNAIELYFERFKQFLHYFEENDRPQPKLDRNTEHGMAVCIGRLREDTLFDYKFACMSHNTLRGAAGGGVLLAELLAAKGYFD